MIITLLTDFGTADHYVAAMKGVILSIDPSILLVDISHDVPAQDVRTAAYLLACCHADFPPRTVHLTVVDPGVGSPRRPIVARSDDQLYVGPDNGVFSLAWSGSAVVDVWSIEQKVAGVRAAGATFHGRDLFAPVAAAIARGLPPEEIGPIVLDPVRLSIPSTITLPDGRMRAEVIHVDRFGNCVTSIRSGLVPTEPGTSIRIRVGTTSIAGLVPYYAAAPDDAPFAIMGSAGFVEIAIRDGSAAKSLGIQAGEPLILET